MEKSMIDRNKKIVKLYIGGNTPAEIGRKFELSESMIGIILNDAMPVATVNPIGNGVFQQTVFYKNYKSPYIGKETSVVIKPHFVG